MFLSVILSCLRRWLRTREMARQLNALSDRELFDIGIAKPVRSRCSIQALPSRLPSPP
ncbi:DUF1127 domain-containing protein [Microvirga splendida]|uniref:DUF1127 domain-containing protein n=1 Tax=Microvirga splendida TaxID=2795727 RepID=A0ABS0Y8M5_9HYPH|nr:DUF1127 domain-containing protein [Microvirga splendida]MBJ6128445.1 DUF1127 domain-containing protein [Microvirga splendida]